MIRVAVNHEQHHGRLPSTSSELNHAATNVLLQSIEIKKSVQTPRDIYARPTPAEHKSATHAQRSSERAETSASRFTSTRAGCPRQRKAKSERLNYSQRHRGHLRRSHRSQWHNTLSKFNEPQASRSGSCMRMIKALRTSAYEHLHQLAIAVPAERIY